MVYASREAEFGQNLPLPRYQNQMGTSYRFIVDPAEPSPVLEWFRAATPSPTEMRTPNSTVFHFKDLGPVVSMPDGTPDKINSPVVTVFSPTVKRGVLWTVGEVHFLPTPLKVKFPKLDSVSRAFAKWLKERPCVFSNKPGSVNEFDYYLEGSIRNYDPPLYAFPSGVAALTQGQYFVSDDETAPRLESICKALRLRGIDC